MSNKPQVPSCNQSLMLIAFRHIKFTLYISKGIIKGIKEKKIQQRRWGTHPGLSSACDANIRRITPTFLLIIFEAWLHVAHVSACAASHLYVTGHLIPHRDQMTQLGVPACLTWCRALTGSAGGHVSTWRSSRLEAFLSAPSHPLFHSCSPLSRLAVLSVSSLPVAWFKTQREANPLRVCWKRNQINVN